MNKSSIYFYVFTGKKLDSEQAKSPQASEYEDEIDDYSVSEQSLDFSEGSNSNGSLTEYDLVFEPSFEEFPRGLRRSSRLLSRSRSIESLGVQTRSMSRSRCGSPKRNGLKRKRAASVGVGRNKVRHQSNVTRKYTKDSVLNGRRSAPLMRIISSHPTQNPYVRLSPIILVPGHYSSDESICESSTRPSSPVSCVSMPCMKTTSASMHRQFSGINGSHVENSTRKVPCVLCSQTFDNNKLLFDHIVIHTPSLFKRNK